MLSWKEHLLWVSICPADPRYLASSQSGAHAGTAELMLGVCSEHPVLLQARVSSCAASACRCLVASCAASACPAQTSVLIFFSRWSSGVCVHSQSKDAATIMALCMCAAGKQALHLGVMCVPEGAEPEAPRQPEALHQSEALHLGLHLGVMCIPEGTQPEVLATLPVFVVGLDAHRPPCYTPALEMLARLICGSKALRQQQGQGNKPLLLASDARGLMRVLLPYSGNCPPDLAPPMVVDPRVLACILSKQVRDTALDHFRLFYVILRMGCAIVLVRQPFESAKQESITAT
eukprot:1136787-Pelagomonas_calceolata.AAC.6